MDTTNALRAAATGVGVVGLAPGAGDLLAGVENLRSLPFRIIVRTP